MWAEEFLSVNTSLKDGGHLQQKLHLEKMSRCLYVNNQVVLNYLICSILQLNSYIHMHDVFLTIEMILGACLLWRPLVLNHHSASLI